MCQRNADGMANSVDPDQTAPAGSSLIRVCAVCLCLSVLIFKIFTVKCMFLTMSKPHKNAKKNVL